MNGIPKRKRIRLPREVYTQHHAFFITIGTHQKHPWFGLHPSLCEKSVQLIRDLSITQIINTYAWCIMPDHIHFLIQGSDVINVIRLFKGRLTPHARGIEPKRKLWQRSFFDHGLRREESLFKVACYIWENPVRKKIVKDPTEYLWAGSEVWQNWRSYYSGIENNLGLG